MIIALVLALLPQSQSIRLERPPSTSFVVYATVPAPSPLRSVSGWPSSSRPVFELITDGTDISEVSVLVPAGTTRVDLTAGADTGPSLIGPALSWLAQPGRAVLWIDGHPFSLSNPAHFAGWHRQGRVHATARMHRQLGAYGHAEYWWDVRADGGIDLALLWHRAIPGPDVRFTQARLTVAGATWAPSVVPPACTYPHLVRPRSDGAQHVIPQQMGMAWWIHVAGPREVVGIADWSHGGYLPSGFPVAQDTPREPYAAKLADARSRLANLQPEPSWGDQPVSSLWPASGVRFGGEGGGNGRLPLDGVQWAASAGDADALEFERIGLLRVLARARIRLDASGGPLTIPGNRTWAFGNSEFIPRYGEPGGRADSPWEYDRWPVSWAGAADPRAFSDHDDSALPRRQRHALTLAWLACDPIATLMVREGATRMALTFAALTPPQQAFIGTDVGAREANAALAMTAARALGDHQYDSWLAAYVEHLRQAQMLSGCLVARLGGYPSENEPFDAYPGIRLQGAAEFAYHMLALRSIGGADDALLGCARGLELLATDDEPGDIGLYYFTATGRDNVRYVWEGDWVPGFHDALGEPGTSGYYTSFDVFGPLAIALELNSPHTSELLHRTFGTSNLAAVRSIVRGWGVQAPSEFTGTPIEQVCPLLGVLP